MGCGQTVRRYDNCRITISVWRERIGRFSAIRSASRKFNSPDIGEYTTRTAPNPVSPANAGVHGGVTRGRIRSLTAFDSGITAVDWRGMPPGSPPRLQSRGDRDPCSRGHPLPSTWPPPRRSTAVRPTSDTGARSDVLQLIAEHWRALRACTPRRPSIPSGSPITMAVTSHSLGRRRNGQYIVRAGPSNANQCVQWE